MPWRPRIRRLPPFNLGGDGILDTLQACPRGLDLALRAALSCSWGLKSGRRLLMRRYILQSRAWPADVGGHPLSRRRDISHMTAVRISRLGVPPSVGVTIKSTRDPPFSAKGAPLPPVAPRFVLMARIAGPRIPRRGNISRRRR